MQTPDPKTNIESLRTLSTRIEEAFEAGANTQGRQLLEQALKEAEAFPAYHEYFRGGAARYLANDKEDQTRRIELALDLQPDDAFLMRALAISLSNTGHDEDALTWFDRTIARNPDDFVAMRRKGVSLSRLGRYDEALMWFDNALQTNPHDAASMRNLGVSLSKCGRNEEALAWFDRAIAENPRDHAAYRQKGVSYAVLGQLEKALTCYDKALEIQPGNPAALINKARTLIECREYDEAIAVYDELIAHDPNNPYHYLEKAIALSKMDRPKEAGEVVHQAYELANPSETLRRGINYWQKRLGLDAGTRPDAPRPKTATPDPGGEYGDIARVMEKTWEIFREDIRSFRHKIEEAKNNFNVFINSSSMFAKDKVFLLGARKWNSFTPTLPLGEDDETSVGGGYFLYANGVGTVIDPGFDFLENFNAMGGRLADIGNIVITHAHNDHTNDLESILTLFYQRTKNARKNVSGRFGSKGSRPAVNLFMNLGAFQKFSPMINLRASDHIGRVTVIAPGEEYDIPGSGIVMRVLPAHHDEIFSKTYAVGLHFTLPTRPAKHVVFTGDTGLFPSGADIRADNVADLEIGSQYGFAPGEIDYFIPHLGSIGDNELQSPDRQDRLGDSFYPNHLGVQGLIRLITMLRPKYVFVSEFGEELKGFIVLLMELINRCVREIDATKGVSESGMPVILPMDLYFFCDLAREEIYCARSESFEPLGEVGYRHLEKNNMSQFYYERNGFDATGCDEYFALKKLEYACKINSGPFSDKSNRTHRFLGPPA